MTIPPPNHPDRGIPSSGSGLSGSEPERNGAADAPHGNESTNGAAEKLSGMDRAEVIVDKVAERVATLANTVWGKKILTAAERAREAAQDFWAEVQNVRHGKSS